MKVSIVTPCYNGSKYIAETINSVLNQTYSDWEMIIVNDGSTDNSAEILSEFAKKDQRIKVLTQKNGGSANARNNGIKNASGRFLALLDADDLWDANFLEDQVAFMQEKNATLVFCSYRRIDAESKEILYPLIAKEQTDVKDMMLINRIGCLSALYDMSKFGKVYLDESLKSVLDDYAFWLTIIKKCEVAYGNQKVLASYRVLASSTTGKKYKLVKKHYRFNRDYLKLGVFGSIYRTIVWAVSGVKKFWRF